MASHQSPDRGQFTVYVQPGPDRTVAGVPVAAGIWTPMEFLPREGPTPPFHVVVETPHRFRAATLDRTVIHPRLEPRHPREGWCTTPYDPDRG